MKKMIGLLAGLLVSCSSFAQVNLAVAAIPTELREGMDAVVRFDETEFYIEGLKSSVTRKHWAITVFNEGGEARHSMFKAYYDKLSQVKRIEGTLYDAGGKVLKRLKSADITDISLASFGSDITDNRVKVAEFDKKYYPYPYTVEFSFELKSSNMMFYPLWVPAAYERMAIESAVFRISAPAAMNYHKLALYVPESSKITRKDNRNEETWEIRGYKTPEFEHYARTPSVPQVITAPVEFQIDDYTGKINSWEDISSFYYHLNAGRDKLPPKTIAELNALVGAEQGTMEKIRKIYAFVQSRSRYQSIQLGLGGWQTIPAINVAEKGYGDCKALTNFTIALLKSAGIEAYAALIRAGDDAIMEHTEIPRMSFNHVIACVPVKNDTIWLECTSQDAPFGYQSDFTGNRLALLIKPSGGRLVSTTSYTPEINRQAREAVITVAENGDGKVRVKTVYGGIQHDTRAEMYRTLSAQDQKDWLHRRINLPDIRITAVNNSRKKERIPVLEESLEIEVNRLCTFSGKRMFLRPNLFETFLNLSSVSENRKEALFLNPNSFNFFDTDSLVFDIPAHFEPEYMPKDFTLVAPFGEYSTRISKEENRLVYRRNLRITGGVYPKETYDEWINFIRKVNNNDKQRVVLVNKKP